MLSSNGFLCTMPPLSALTDTFKKIDFLCCILLFVPNFLPPCPSLLICLPTHGGSDGESGGGVSLRPAGIVCYAGVLFPFYGIKHDNIHLQGGNINVLQGLNETIRQTNSINKKLIWSGVRGVLMLSWCCVLMVLVKVWYLVSDVCVFLC